MSRRAPGMAALLRLRTRAGQSTTETVLLIAVIVVAAWAVTGVAVEPFQQGTQGMQDDISTWVGEGAVDVPTD